MANASRFVLPYQTVIDNSGVPISGAKLFFYESGTDTPLNTFSDAALTIPNTNPVVADAGGRFPNIFMLPQSYKVILTDAADDQIWEADPVNGTGGSVSNINLRTVTGNTTVNNTDGIIEADATLGSITITYPVGLSTTQSALSVRIVKVDQTNNQVIIVDDTGPTVRYALVEPANGAYMQSCIIYSNGASMRVTD